MSAYTLIDAHCHLDFPVFDIDRDAVLQRAKNKCISDIIIPGTEQQYWSRINALCSDNPHLHACYGLHPYWINSNKKYDLTRLEQYLSDTNAVAVGECGLDFRKKQADRKIQLYFFEAQMRLAENCQLPVVIHSVNATETVIKMLKKFKGLKGMIHSYSGSFEQAEQLIEMNFLISIGANVTYDNAKKIKGVARKLPLTSLLLETDAPDQPDQKHAGKRNEPAYLANTLEVIAALREEPVQTIAQQTTVNVKKLFNI